jgi:hypothetical protein
MPVMGRARFKKADGSVFASCPKFGETLGSADSGTWKISRSSLDQLAVRMSNSWVLDALLASVM